MKHRRLWRAALLDLTLLCLVAAALLLAALPQSAVEAAAAGERKRLPILMYHSVLKDPARAGAYVVPPETLAEDLAYLKAHAYTTVTIAELTAYAAGTGSLPEKPVLLTFDDGYYNNLTYVLPLLEEYDMRAVLSVVGSYTDQYTQTPDPNPSYGYLSWTELEALAATGRFEIQNHSYDMHTFGSRRGSSKRAGESESAYRQAFVEDTARMQALLAAHGLAGSAYTYPFGSIGPNSGAYLKELGFTASLSCFERDNLLTRGDPDCLFCLGRYNRPAGSSTADYMARVLGE